MITASQIKPNTPVVCSNNRQFAVVNHMEGTETIKLTKDDKGQHHYIPTSWVKSVDDRSTWIDRAIRRCANGRRRRGPSRRSVPDSYGARRSAGDLRLAGLTGPTPEEGGQHVGGFADRDGAW